jgi:hypothetical protein
MPRRVSWSLFLRDESSDTMTRIGRNGVQLRKTMASAGHGIGLGMGVAAKGLGMVALGAGAAGVAGVSLGIKMTGAAGTMELMDRKARIVYGKSFPQMAAWSDKVNDRMGLTERQVLNMASAIQDLLVPMGFSRDRAADMSKTLTSLSGALSEWSGGTRSATEVGDILAASLMGERDALQGLGIGISQAQVDTQMLANKKKGLKFATEEQASAQATLDLIMAKSVDAQKAYADGAGTLAAKSALARAKLSEFTENILVGATPALSALGDVVVKEALPRIDKLGKWFADHPDDIKVWALEGGAALIDFAGFAVQAAEVIARAGAMAVEEVRAWALMTLQVAESVNEFLHDLPGTDPEVESALKNIRRAQAQIENWAKGPEASLRSFGGELAKMSAKLHDQASSVDTAANRQRAHTAAVKSAKEASAEFATALNGLSGRAIFGTATLKGATFAAMANRLAFQNAANAARDHANGIRASTGSAEKGRSVLAAHRQQLINQAINFGLSRTAAMKYVDQLLKVPKSVKTDVKANTKQGAAAVGAYVKWVGRQLQSINDEGVVVKLGVMQTAGFRSAVGHGLIFKQAGGAVPGPSGLRGDRVPAMLEVDEHVITRDEVRAAGGHGAVEAQRASWRRGYAAGGAVLRMAGAGDRSQLPRYASAFERALDEAGARIASRLQSKLISPGLVAGLNFAKAQAGDPYRYAGVGPNAFDCCIVGPVRVYGPDGIRPIRDIRAGDRVFSYVDGRLEPHVVTAAWQSKRQPVFAVRTRNRTVTASANHPFMRLVEVANRVTHREDAVWPGLVRMPRGSRAGAMCAVSTCEDPVQAAGMCNLHYTRHRKHGDPRIFVTTGKHYDIEWARLDELKRGDLLVQPRAMPLDAKPYPELPDGTPVDADVAWLIGAAVGDGNVTNSGLNLCLYGDDRKRATRIITGRWHCEATPNVHHGLIAPSARLRDALTSLGMRRLGPDKRLPDAVWSWEPDLQRAFLDGYCDADGHHPANPKRHGERTYSSASEELIEDVRALHMALGDAVSNVSVNRRTKPITIKGKLVKHARPLYSFTVWGRTGRGEVALRARSFGITDWLDAGDFTLAAVRDVTYKGEQDTWDIEVQGAHNFVADGVVVHNSGYQSAITNSILGRYPYRRIGATGNFPWSMFAPGPGNYMIGSVRGNPGHMAGTLLGVNVESRGGDGVVVGSRARGARHPYFGGHIWHLKGYAAGGAVGDAAFDLLNPRGLYYLGRAVREQWNDTQWYHAGGSITEPIMGVGRSGRTYGFQAGETVLPRGGGITVNIYALDSRGAADATVAALRKYMQSHGGAVPIKVTGR